MPAPPVLRRPVAWLAAGLTTVAVLTAAPAQALEPAATPAAPLRPDGALSARLATLQDLDPHAATAPALSMARSGAGSLVEDASGRVLVQVLLTDTDPTTVAALRRLGEVIDVRRTLQRATLLVPVAGLAALGEVPGVRFADLVPAPLHGTGVRTAVGRAAAARGKDCHPLRTEADGTVRAGTARSRFGVDGSGVRVGVLSDSYDVDPDAATYAYDDVRSGELPGPQNPCGYTTPVDVLAEGSSLDGTGLTDEGRAMLQGVHDLAPGAALSFASALGGPDMFAKQIRRLGRSGADVIVDDITYLTEPFFQQGVVDRAVSTVVANGATYFSSAGNSNTVYRGRDVSSWETPAVRLADCPLVEVPSSYGPLGRCVAFDPAGSDTGYDLTLASRGTITPVLQWAEPVNGVSDDFDLFVVDATTGEVLASSTTVQARSQTPVEYLSWTNRSPADRAVRVVVNRFSGKKTPRLKLTFVTMTGLQSLEHDRSAGPDIVGPTVFGHNGGVDAISVAAVPYDAPAQVQAYSARGPATHYFGPVKGTRAAKPLATPRIIRAPQLAAPDGWRTTFFGPLVGTAHRFYGTSAAAPVAAAVAALMRAATPSLSARQVLTALRATARSVDAPPAAAGAGLVDAVRAVALVAPPPAPLVTATKSKPRAVKVSFRAAAVRPGGAPVLSYQARCESPGRAARTASAGSAGHILVGGLHRGSRYDCAVRALTTYAAGPYSAAGPSQVAAGKPSRPRRVHAEVTGRRALTVHFRAPANSGGRKLLGYLARCEPTGAGKARHSATADAGATTLKVRKLTRGAAYRCIAYASNKLGTSKPSKPSARVRLP